jgi:hypothetical protein
MILEDHSFGGQRPGALRSGAADEVVGKTGLAHFLEHPPSALAEFPNASATEAIYDSGGEWHGYTWLDQTTYFSRPRIGSSSCFRSKPTGWPTLPSIRQQSRRKRVP